MYSFSFSKYLLVILLRISCKLLEDIGNIQFFSDLIWYQVQTDPPERRKRKKKQTLGCTTPKILKPSPCMMFLCSYLLLPVETTQKSNSNPYFVQIITFHLHGEIFLRLLQSVRMYIRGRGTISYLREEGT